MALGVSARCLTWRSQDSVQGGREMMFSRLGAADAGHSPRASACLSWFGTIDLTGCVTTVTTRLTPSLG
jgi:hypothetical protein